MKSQMAYFEYQVLNVLNEASISIFGGSFGYDVVFSFSNGGWKVDDINAMSAKLGGGTYKGLAANGTECTVFVVDNGGSGTAYSIEVAPPTYNTANLRVANATVTLGTMIQPRSQIVAYGIAGFNFESYFRIDENGGK